MKRRESLQAKPKTKRSAKQSPPKQTGLHKPMSREEYRQQIGLSEIPSEKIETAVQAQ